MTTTINPEPFAVAHARYEELLAVEIGLLARTGSRDVESDWESAHDDTSVAIDRLIDTPALTLPDAVAKLRLVIQHAHLEGRSSDLADPTVIADALASPERDGAWPLLRVLEDLERHMPPTGSDASEELRRLATSLGGWESAEQYALAAESAACAAEEDETVALCQINALDALLEHAIRGATGIAAKSVDDIRRKGRILQVLTRCARWPDFERTDWEEAFIISLANDVAAVGAT